MVPGIGQTKFIIRRENNTMQIIAHYPEQLNKKHIYALTMSPETLKMKDAKGSKLQVAAWCLYEDLDKDGEPRRVLTIATPEDETYATNSSTFQNDFQAMVDLFGPGGVDAIKVISGQSKAGREYITCAYAGNG